MLRRELCCVFRCRVNCARKISTSIKLSVESHCERQCYNITSYKWMLYEARQSAPTSNSVWHRRQDLQLLLKTPFNSRSLVIRENALIGGKRYRLAVIVNTTDGFSVMTANDIFTAVAPYGGNCSVSPSTGISLKTDFYLRCYEWKSDSDPLSYQFQYQLENGLYSMIYHGMNNSIITWLPSGNISDNFLVKFLIIITDHYGASAPAVHLTVQVGLSFSFVINSVSASLSSAAKAMGMRSIVISFSTLTFS